MIVVLDSNIFCQDWRLAGPSFRTFLEGLKLVPVQLKVPAVVLDEVCNKFREALSDHHRQLSTAVHTIGKLVGRTMSGAPALDIEAEVAHYRKHVEAVLAACGANVLPYPKTPHEEIVRRELARRKPFRANGAGYRDFLIWESVRVLVGWGHERVGFVTANSQDFGEGPELHADFKGDVFAPRAFRIFRSLHAFNEELVLPRLKMAAEVRNLMPPQGRSLDVGAWVNLNLVDLIQNADVGELCFESSERLGRAWPSELLDIERITVTEVGELAEQDQLVRLSIIADVAVSRDKDFSFWYERVRIDASVDLVLAAKSETVDSHELVRLETMYGTFEL
jgi:hypothetical protein